MLSLLFINFVIFCVFAVETCEKQKYGHQVKVEAEALLSMESPSTTNESKSFLQGILHSHQGPIIQLNY